METNCLTLDGASYLVARIEALEQECQDLRLLVQKQRDTVSLIAAGLNANSVAIFGILNAIGYHRWVKKCVDRRLDLGYEDMGESQFSQEARDAFDTVAASFRYCMTESQEAVEAALGDGKE